MVIYVPITILQEMGARLASNGVILCREKVPYTAIQAIFELDGVRGMGPRIQPPSLVDEYVCATMDGEDGVRASERYIMKVAAQCKDDLEIPFTFRNNVALALQKVQSGHPTENQAKEIINHITRAIVHSSPKFECSCRWCPWCLGVIPASIIRCLFCNAQMISVDRFMDQSSLGKPRSLDSEIVIEISEENIADIDVAVQPEIEEPQDEARAAQEEQNQVDAGVEAIMAVTHLRMRRKLSMSTARLRTLRRNTSRYQMMLQRNPLQSVSTPKKLAELMTNCWATSFSNVATSSTSTSTLPRSPRVSSFVLPTLIPRRGCREHPPKRSTSLGHGTEKGSSTKRPEMKTCSGRSTRPHTRRFSRVIIWTFAMR